MKTYITARRIDFSSSFIGKNKSVFILFFTMISAVCFGVLFMYYNAGADICSRISEIFSYYIEAVKNNSKPEIFSGLLLSAFGCFVAITLLSTSIIGTPLIYSVIFFKLSGYGSVLYTVYSEYGLTGIEYSILVLLPGKYLMILSLLLLADSSTKLCNMIIKDTQERAQKVKKQIMITVISSVIMLLSVLIDFFALTVFSELFTF